VSARTGGEEVEPVWTRWEGSIFRDLVRTSYGPQQMAAWLEDRKGHLAVFWSRYIDK